ncbi:CRE-SRE-3 protein, partial [Aphelenchoides avenae]
MADAAWVSILTALNVLELLLGVICVAGSFPAMLIVFRHPVFHRNLMCLVGSILVHWLVGTSNELFLLHGPIKYLEYGRIFAYTTVLGTIVTVLFERSIATIQLRSYERQRSNLVVVGSIVYSWHVGAISTFFIWQEWLSMIFPVAFGVVYVVTCLAIFATVEYVNRKRYERARRGISTFTLSQRFQLTENIRSLTVIRRCSYVGGAGFAFAFAVVGADSYLHTEASLYIARSFVNFSAYTFSIAFAVTALLSVNVWWRVFR